MEVRFNVKMVIFILLFFGLASVLFALDEEQVYKRRIVWRGNENFYRYAVEIQKSENGRYRGLMREYTTTTFLTVSLPEGDYRFRITPHDILDRPLEATQWIQFEIKPAPEQIITESMDEKDTAGENEQIEVIDIIQSPENNEQPTDNDEQPTESNEKNSARLNTIGISAGTDFTDPMVIFALHGTYAPFRRQHIENIFFKAGCDIGLISRHEDAEKFYSLYPYINIGYFLPFKNRGGLFACAGAGYITGSYQFSHGGTAKLNYFTANVTAGANIIDAINISYTFKTDFTGVSHQTTVGYVYRFKQRR